MGVLTNEFRLGDILLRTRFVMAPMTRSRAPDDVLFWPIGVRSALAA